MFSMLIATWLAIDSLTGVSYEARVSRLVAHQPEPGYIGLTRDDVQRQLGKPSGQQLDAWAYRKLAPGPNTVVPVTVLRFRDGRVVAAVSGVEMVGCIITVPRR